MPQLAHQLATASNFGPIDWLIVLGYMGLVILIGLRAGRRERIDGDLSGNEMFLAGRSMPMWAVAISLVATSQSAATFIGGPQQAYQSNLTYLSASIGSVLAIIIVAVLFVPAFYRHNVTSIYELPARRFGPAAGKACSAMFLLGRVLASGARLFIVAIPFSLIMFGESETGRLAAQPLYWSIIIVTAAAVLYTIIGGIRAVIWTDVLQAGLLLLSVVIAFAVLAGRIDAPVSDVVTALSQAGEGGSSKLTIIDPTPSLALPYTIWSALIAWTIFNVAAYGTDQDLVQRLLTCKTAKKGAWSTIMSQAIALPTVALFLILGLGLYVFYQMPELVGGDGPGSGVDDSRKVFVSFILHEMGPGLRGLMLAGLFAAAMSSLDSALNAMSSTIVTDFARPWFKLGDRGIRWTARISVAAFAMALCGFACACVNWQPESKETLINFALNIMGFAYAGLLAVFLAALITRRGNGPSAIAALLTGLVLMALQTPAVWSWFESRFVASDDSLPWGFAPLAEQATSLAGPWKLTVAAVVSFLVCCVGQRRPSPDHASAPGQSDAD